MRVPTEKPATQKNQPTVATKKTDLRRETQTTNGQNNIKRPKFSYDPSRCPIHRSNHSLNDCRVFMNKSLDEKRKY